jgi:hypothetical protein
VQHKIKMDSMVVADDDDDCEEVMLLLCEIDGDE